MSLSNELALLDATAQAELVRKKEVKPIELVDAAIERIEDRLAIAQEHFREIGCVLLGHPRISADVGKEQGDVVEPDPAATGITEDDRRGAGT